MLFKCKVCAKGFEGKSKYHTYVSCSPNCNAKLVKRLPLSERLWNFVKKTDTCWEWQGYVDTAGYGSISVKNIPYRVHRISWELTFGDIPKGMSVCHKCDNRICVNPQHFFLGTTRDNVLDMVKKKRNQHKLTEQEVLEIRRLSKAERLSGPVIAKKFNVNPSTVNRILSRKLWDHV